MSVRKISLKTFPLFLCFAWPGQCKMHTPKISFNLARNIHSKRQTDFFFSLKEIAFYYLILYNLADM